MVPFVRHHGKVFLVVILGNYLPIRLEIHCFIILQPKEEI